MHSAILPLMLTAAGMADINYLPPLKESTPHHQLNFRWRNQKQVRKNRRRAHAAGKRNAFN
jgi:hypothetical protein